MTPFRIKTLTEYHRLLNLPKPEHPLVSLIDVGSFQPPPMDGPVSLIFDFYCIACKTGLNAKIKYGQQECDFDEGQLFCMAPGQVWTLEIDKQGTKQPSGWMILVHPDFLLNTPLARTIRQYAYFGYSVYEALYLSEREENLLTGIARYIEQEYHTNIDRFSNNVIVAQLEVILTYAERFYQRQFLTRKVSSHRLVEQVETILDNYFKSDQLAQKGLPAVGDIAGQLNVTPGYLGELLKALTGRSTQQHIHDKLIEKAKEQLSTTGLSVSEVAYQLGFEHPASFSKLFKAKTNLSPVQFRATFN